MALHKELFAVDEIDFWFVRGFREALSRWQASGDPRDIDVAKLPDVRLEAPGIVSFSCLTGHVCDMLLEETAHYREAGMPQRAPNSMNNYGLVLNEVGMRPVFSAVLERYLSGVGARLFGSDDVRASQLHGQDLGVDDWGGSSLSSHHTFVVRYRPDEDRHLDMHIDDCDVTFNFGLMDGGDYSGSDLAFCGMKGSADLRRRMHTYRHVKGRCVVHSGKRRHGALDIEAGERSSLIMWTKSDSYRWTVEYQLKVAGPSQPEKLPPDAVCLSYTHDYDYDSWVAKLNRKSTAPAVAEASLDSAGKPLLPVAAKS